MTPIDAVRTSFAKTIDFSGRASRTEFWWFKLFSWMLMILSVLMFPLISMLESTLSLNADVAAFLAVMPFLIVVVILIIPSLSSSIRRLHDLNYSGWFVLLFAILAQVTCSLSIFLEWYIFAQPGTIEVNRYGPPPTEDLLETFS